MNTSLEGSVAYRLRQVAWATNGQRDNNQSSGNLTQAMGVESECKQFSESSVLSSTVDT